MATTESRSGFRLPWSSDGQVEDDAQRVQDTDVSTGTADESAPVDTSIAADPTTSEPASADEPGVAASADEPGVAAAPPDPAPGPSTTPSSLPARPGPRKPNRFLADLTRAMQAAAEAEREQTQSQFHAAAKTFIEGVHARSATEAADLRQRADDDIAGIKDWSKAEIARIRDDTEKRIGDRRAQLERQVEDHAALIELEIERVQGKIATFEAEMDRFFDRLRGEDDPTTFAGLAENLPEPPAFDDEPLTLDAVGRSVPRDVAPDAPAVDAPVAEPPTAAGTEPATAPDDREAAFAAIEASARAADTAEPQPELEERASSDTPVADAAAAEGSETAIEASTASEPPEQPVQAPEHEASVEQTVDQAPAEPDADADPRIAALGLSPDFAAAEAEAALDAAGDEDQPEIAEIADDALAARLAGLVPGDAGEAGSPAPTTATTRLVVVGLVSVASIAGFKRQLGRMAGVRSVGVSSGPDGEFVFAINHDDGVDLRETIPSLSGFKARVTSATDGTINVSAHDPESDG
jgi:hypothetical protein